MKPYRELLPANASFADDADPAEASSTSSISSSKKRAPQTKVACSACRRKRTKCDGRRPVCSTCAATTRRSAEESALKKKNSDLLRRSRLLEQLFHLLTLRTEDESIAIIRRMRTTNLDEDIENLISFIKSGDLLMMFHSAESGSKDVEAVNPTAAGDVDSGAARTSSDEATALLETLFASIAKLDQHSRASVLSRLRSRINELDAETGLEQSATNELESPSLDTTQSLVSEIETAVQHTETTPAAPRR
ncbi:Nitrogen assimilation transcription factor nit-4 like protein [Verticillium longisporum]|nr:Nitrogen assimilation transcription factor nit-4 like protein [Verticillium longisporum]